MITFHLAETLDDVIDVALLNGGKARKRGSSGGALKTAPKRRAAKEEAAPKAAAKKKPLRKKPGRKKPARKQAATK